MKNKRDAIMIKPREFLRSLPRSPGLIKRQNSNKIYGKATTKPSVIEVQICAENCPATVLDCIRKDSSLKQKLSCTPIIFESLHNNL